MVPDTRPAIGATPTAFRPFFSFCTPTWSIGCVTGSGAGPSISFRYSFENLELLDAPVLDQELQPRLGRSRR